MMAARPSLSAKVQARGPTFEAAYRAHHDRVYSQCLRYGGGNPSFAEDVLALEKIAAMLSNSFGTADDGMAKGRIHQ